MFIRPWLEALKSRCMPGNRLNKRRVADHKPLQMQVESLEEKAMLSAFDLVTVIPNQGVFLSDGAKMNEAPKEVTLRFSPGQSITPSTIAGAISITRAGVDGVFNSSATPSTDDATVPIGYIGPGDLPNEVIVRFAQTLVDDQYQIHIAGTGNAALKSTTDTFNNGTENAKNTFHFELDLGAQVQAVVPQPVIRSSVFSATAYGALTDGDVVTVTAGANTYKFEINLLPNAGTAQGNIAVNISNGATPAQIADALVAAINANAGGNLSASDGGANTITVAGAAFEPVVTFTTTKMDAFAKSYLTIANAANLSDGDLVKITLNDTVYTFELNKAPNNSVGIGNIRVDFAAGDSAAVIAAALAAKINALSINTPTTQLKATVVGNSIALTALSTLGTPAAVVTTAQTGVLTQVVGKLTQATTKVVVYFNQDQLNAASANDPKFYQLVDATTSAVLLPSNVTYTWNPVSGLSVAVLTFAAPLSNSTYNIKIGASTESNGTTSTAVQAGTIFSNQDFVTNSYLGDGTGTSTDASDVDLYQFSTSAAGAVSLTLDSSTSLNGVITLLDSNGAAIGSPMDANGAGLQEILNAAGLPAGTYYARVSSSSGTGGYRLTIHTSLASSTSDDNSSFSTATSLGNLGTSGLSASGQIEAQGAFVTMPPLPGGSDEPGQRELPAGAFTGLSAPEVNHGIPEGQTPVAPSPTAEQTYSFPLTYNASAAGLGILNNQITPEQKEIIRQIFAIYSYEAGIQFREVPSGGNEQIVVGDIRASAPSLDAGAAGGISGTPLIINAIFYAGDNTFGGGFTTTAFHEIGHNLGLGHSYDVPSIQGAGATDPATAGIEPVFTGDNDLLHLLRLLPDNSSDIDLYQFNVTQSGTLSAQTIAERLSNTDLLNTVLTLYKQDASGARTVVARNDDFYSKDSGIELPVDPGTYFIGVTSVGNEDYDPSISDSGFGGRSQGAYQLKLDFKPTATSISGLQDTTGQYLNGDNDGKAGGQYNGWFTVAPTVIVDKLAPAGGTGTLASPYNTISAGLAAAGQGSIVRIVGNGGADGDASTIADNVPYLIGQDYDQTKTPLADGATFQVPKGVTVMIDAGAVVKLHAQTVDVGSSSSGIDRSHGALQVLGTPVNNVTFTSWRDDASGSIDDAVNGAPSGNDWGGIVFRQDSDSATNGVFLNIVNHATIQYGGGKVSVDGSTPVIYNALDLETSRPTLTNNIIRNNADAAISANPDSFKADDGRIGPDVHGNLITDNSTNGLFIRVQTPLGGQFETLNVIAEFASTDITYVITQNLILNGRPAGALSNPVSARLMIDPGVVVKLSGARIETGIGSSNLIAEGTAANPIHFTSQQDDRYGTGGTFDLKNDGFGSTVQPQAGNWSGIFVGQTSTASLDHVTVTYAGGTSEISGNTDFFNPVETLQGTLRITNSLFEDNLGGAASTNRGGRGGNDNATIFVRGAQPILVNNIFRDNFGSVISINANSMQAVIKPDYGRSTGAVEEFNQFDDNYGPLVRLNKFANSTSFPNGASILGMTVRAEELTIESIWDDTDIAHVVTGTIVSDEFHHVGGLTLQSSATGSLVVKLLGANAGFEATGDPLEISDRIGGTVDVIGQPNFPVILTSLKDDSVSAGFKPNGFPQFDTNGDNNDGRTASAGSPGDWNSVLFTQYSNDTNVALVNETEPGLNHGNDINSTVANPQFLGNLAPNLDSGDENRRLGYEVHGFISPDSPGDVDVYSFTANPGTQVWVDTDFTSQRLDVMVELLDSAGNVLARSLNSQDESANPAAWLTSGLAGLIASDTTGQYASDKTQIVNGQVVNSDLNTLTADPTLGGDFYTSNFHDAGFRAVLPGVPSTTPITYFVRVRSQPKAGQEAAPIPVGGNGLTSGEYQLQIRLKQVDHVPGSTVQYASINYATNGIETRGLPAHSPLMGESGETTASNDTPGTAQNLGPFLQTDRNTLSVSGSLNTSTDVDFYKFTVDYSQVQVIGGGSDGGKFFPTMFDIDWADGLTRPDTSIAVYNANGQLMFIGRASDLADDQPRPGQGQDLTDLSRGSLGTKDPSIGSVNLPAGVNGISEAGGTDPNPPTSGLTTYYVAVFSNGVIPTALSAVFNSAASPENQLVRLEPVDSIRRVVEDHIGTTGYTSQGTVVAPTNGPLFNVTTSISLQTNIRPFTLSDVNLFIVGSSSLGVVDPFNGTQEIQYTGLATSRSYSDIDMRSDGRLFAVQAGPNDFNLGSLAEFNTGTGGLISESPDGIATPGVDSYQQNFGTPDALAIHNGGPGNYDYVVYAIANNDGYTTNKPTDSAIPIVPEDPNGDGVSKLYRANSSGNAGYVANSTGAVGNIRDQAGVLNSTTTGMQFFNGVLYGVSAAGQFYRITDGLSPAQANPDPDLTDAAVNRPPNLVATSSIFDLTSRTGGTGFVGLTDAPQNVENAAYAGFLFALTTDGKMLAINPNDPTATHLIFDSNADNKADSDTLTIQGGAGKTGLAFSPVDYNLWHPTELRGTDAGHGINTTTGTTANPSVDNSRSPSKESTSGVQFGSESTNGTTEANGGASMYFGIEDYNPNSSTNYFNYQSGGQYGVISGASQQDLTAPTSAIHNNYNAPGGTAGSLVTNGFSLEGYNAGDKPTLYFTYFLDTQNAGGNSANSMLDSARVYVSPDNGLTWQLLATNNSTLSTTSTTNAELPSYLSADKNASPSANQQVQELFDTASWRQARVDLSGYVGFSQLKLRFDFSTSGNTGTVVDPNTGLKVPSDDKSNPTFVRDTGSQFGVNGTVNAQAGAQSNAFEGFYIDDIIVGFAGRGEMVTNAPTQSAGFSNLEANPFSQRTTNPDPAATKQLLTGAYQLEIRRGQEYGALASPTKADVRITPTLDVNDRLTSGQTVMVGNSVQDGATVTVYDGLITRTFEFDSNGSVSGSNISVTISPTQGGNASNLASAITAAFSGRNSVIAKAVASTLAAGESDRVDIFDAIKVTAVVAATPAASTIPAQSESNDTIATATVSGFSASNFGTFTSSGTIGDGTNGTKDVDFYSVTLVAGQRVAFDVDLPSGGDSILRLFDSNGLPLAISDNNAGPAPEFSTLESFLVYVAPRAGTYYFGISGKGNSAYNPTVAGSGTAGSTFNYTVRISGAASVVPLSVSSYVRLGDDNLTRTQGQIIIQDNQIINSSKNGILVNDNDRFGSVPHPGAPLNTPVPNDQKLVTGMYLQNNTIARFGTSGITITGDSNQALGAAIVPFVKVVNNTIYGSNVQNPTDGTVGVLITNNASPTLLNNAIVNTATSISVVNSATGEIEANLFQGNSSNPVIGNNSLVNVAASSSSMFVNAAKNNFYPASGSPLIDSSRSVYNDRAEYIAVTGVLGIPKSPIVAPLYDQFGQLRVDDLSQPGPANQPGLGQNPFQDRGSVERADFDGGVVIPSSPQDNDGNGVDLDPTSNTIWIDAANPASPFINQTQFVLQLIDTGIGIDDSTVDLDGSDFILTKNGTPLVQGTDYFFTYNQNTNEAIFTSVSTFELDSRYQISVKAAGITDLAGNVLQNNHAVSNGTSLLYFDYVVTDGKNDAPVTYLNGVALPASPVTAAPITINEDSSVTFSSANGNAITVSDKDAFLAPDGDPNAGPEAGRIRVTVSVPNGFGTFTLATGSDANLIANGGSVSPIGVAASGFILEGRIEDINTALDGMKYTPTPDFPIGLPAATVNLTVLTEDLGKFGPPAPGNTDPKSSTSILPIVINPVNDAPTITVTTASPITIVEDAAGPTQINLTNITAGGGENQSLKVSATSNNQSLIPNANIIVGYPNLALPAVQPTTGNVQFTALPDQFGTAIVTITVTDAGLDGVFGLNPGTGTNDDLTTTRNVTVNVTPVNDAPTINQPADATVKEDAGPQSINLGIITVGPANEGLPPESQTFTVTPINVVTTGNITPLVNFGTIVQNPDGTWSLPYTPVANGNGTVTFQLLVTDSGPNGGPNNDVNSVTTLPITIKITPVNDAPTVNVPADLTIREDDASNPQHITLTGISGGPLEGTQTVTAVSVTSSNQSVIPNANIVQGVLTGGNLPLTITPLPNQFGVVTITVTITDDGPNNPANGDVNTVTKTFTITILPVNDAPSFNVVPPQTILEDAAQQTITLNNISAGPANESTQTLALSAAETTATPLLVPGSIQIGPIVNGQATVKYTPVANANGTATIRVTLKDNGGTANGGSDTYFQDITINITPVNDAPTLNPIADQPTAGLLLEDSGQQTVNLSGITAGPANESTQNLTVTAVITSGNPNLVNNFIASSVAPNGTATLKYTPVPNEFGTATVTVTVTDSGVNGGANGDVNVTTRTFTITITPVNDAPTIDAIANQTVDEDTGSHTINLTGITVGQANEAPPQTLTATITSDNPALIPNGSFTFVPTPGTSTGTLQYTPAPNGFGVVNVTLTLKDTGGTANGGQDTTTRTFRITVNQVGDTPSSIALSGNSVFENRPAGTLIGNLSTSDVDLPDDHFTYSVVGGTDTTAFLIVGNQLQTSRPLDFEAVSSYTVVVRTTDRFNLFLDQTFTVSVLDINDAPTLDPINNVIFNEDPASPIVINLSGISAGGGELLQSLTVTATSDNPNLFNNPLPISYSSPNGTGTLTLSPRLNANGTATITVTVQDNGGTADGGIDIITRTFTVTVNPVNDSPSNISLTNDTIPEIVAGTPLPANVVVGQLSSTDPDNPKAGDTFSYSLVGGSGATDNARFKIVGDQLIATGPIDFDTQPDYTVRIRSTDNGTPSMFLEKVFTIHSTNVNEPASGVTTGPNPVSGIPTSIPENQPAGSIVGPLIATDPDAGDVNTFALVDGPVPNDNALFQIVNGNLVAKQSFDFETKSSYTLRIRTVDLQGLVFEGPVTINVTNVDEAPTGVNLSNNTVPENVAVGASVGTLSTVDVDHPELFTYSLVTGAGSTDNTRFIINGDQLIVATPLNYEERPNHSYSVRVRATDIGGLTFEKVFTINVTDVNEAPTNLTLTPTTIDENKPVGTVVGTLTPIDQDVGDNYTYTFVAGAGSDDNSKFTLSGNRVLSAVSFDFETKSIYTIRVLATDAAGHQIERQFTIGINDTKDAPVISLADPTLTTTGRKAVVVDPAATITDIDSPNFNGGKLVVFIQSGEQTGDTLSLLSEKGKDPMKLKLTHGKSVLVLGKTTIATVNGGVRGIPLTIQFASGISQELFQRVMRQVTFRGKPFAAPRQVAMQAFDETHLGSNIEIRNINVN
jgi:hypothetical protein